MKKKPIPPEGEDATSQETKAALDVASCSAIHLGMEEQMLTYRRKNFAVEVTPPRKPGGEIRLSVTTNGTQAHSLSFLTEEIQSVIDALVPFLPRTP